MESSINDETVINVEMGEDGAAEILVREEYCEDPNAWGMLLADLAFTIAHCNAPKGQDSKFLKEIVSSFEEGLKTHK